MHAESSDAADQSSRYTAASESGLEQELFQPSPDFKEFFVPTFNVLYSHEPEKKLIRTLNFKLLAKVYGYEDTHDFFSMICLSYVNYIEKKGKKEAFAMLTHLKDLFRRLERIYYYQTKGFMHDAVSYIKSDFKRHINLVDDNDDDLEFRWSTINMYLWNIYHLIYYNSFVVMVSMLDNEDFKSIFCKKYEISKSEFDKHVKTICNELMKLSYGITGTGVRISALTLCLDNYVSPEDTGVGFENFVENSTGNDVWRCSTKFEFFKSPEFKATGLKKVFRTLGRPLDATVMRVKLKKLVRKFATDTEYQHPNGIPKHTKIAEHIYYGDYEEKGEVSFSTVKKLVKKFVEEIAEEKSIKDHKDDSGGTENLDGK